LPTHESLRGSVRDGSVRGCRGRPQQKECGRGRPSCSRGTKDRTGIPCLGLNGGPNFKHNEAFSFQVATTDQAETDRYWNAIVGNGGEESACGWCKDKWGLSWQITPLALTKAVTDPDRSAAKRAFDAMMQMKKIDIAAIEAARRG